MILPFVVLCVSANIDRESNTALKLCRNKGHFFLSLSLRQWSIQQKAFGRMVMFRNVYAWVRGKRNLLVCICPDHLSFTLFLLFVTTIAVLLVADGDQYVHIPVSVCGCYFQLYCRQSNTHMLLFRGIASSLISVSYHYWYNAALFLVLYALAQLFWIIG